MLLAWMPIQSVAQTCQFEMVLEKTDGSEQTFRITEDYPLLQNSYGGEEGVNTLLIQTENGTFSVPSLDIKRLFTREAKVIRGDINGNGSVDVQDATLVVNYILGKIDSEEYDFTLADMNNDDKINVFDVTAILNVILSKSNNPATARRLARQDEAWESICLTVDKNGLLFGVDNPEKYTSFQFDVEVPQGVNLLGVEWNGNIDHTLQFAKNGENRYTVVALSLASTPLSAFNETLLKLRLSEMGEVWVNNVLFVTPDGKAARFNGATIGMTTGIKGLSNSSGKQFFDVSGRRLNMKREQLGKGVYIINNKKVVIK
jgi:hypothetical protein